MLTQLFLMVSLMACGDEEQKAEKENELQEQRKEVAKNKKELAEEKQNLNAQQDQLSEEKNQLTVQQSELDAEKQRLEEERQKLQAELEKQRTELEEAQKKIEEEKKNAEDATNEAITQKEQELEEKMKALALQELQNEIATAPSPDVKLDQTKRITSGNVTTARSGDLLPKAKKQLNSRAKKEGYEGVRNIKLVKQECKEGRCTGLAQAIAYKTGSTTFAVGNGVMVKIDEETEKLAIIREINEEAITVQYEDSSKETVDKSKLSAR